jgi:ferredoxin
MVAPAAPRPFPGAKAMPEPAIDEAYCIGCGACETVCPSKPDKAIHVEGRVIQDEAEVHGLRPGDLGDVQAPAAMSGEAAPGVDREGFPF